ncbi:unnamed protein product [Medioppia subpectinata]|uniref:Neurotransmitter-gated ion-channel transmembrane domain-containing protein n=1 Tax=Medioppia subpectinata TaxID=1979941 RepID=A0A7R9Q5C2_9ACAR|nr:unnamed protein product [Medioppia subpectinata]CAG2113300.1 unnamed protein product [Medioppia subpectinata]
MRAIMLEWLPWILRMERHGIKPPRRIAGSVARMKAINYRPNDSTAKEDKDLEMFAKSRPQMENIWSVEEECKARDATHVQLNRCQTNALTHKTNNHCNHIRDHTIEHNYNRQHFAAADSADQPSAADYPQDSPTAHNNPYSHPLSAKHKKIKEILFEMRFITNRMRRQDDINELIAEWKFAATVLDRLCLIVFSLFTVLSTGLCLYSAPQLMHFAAADSADQPSAADYPQDSPTAHNNPYSHPLSAKHKKIKEILFEMRFITNRMRRQDDINELIAEWKFAATVLDRLCLIVFSLFTVLSTGLCLYSAPQLMV